MLPWYENNAARIRVFESVDLNCPSHLHGDIEVVYVLEGRLDYTAGDRREIMEKGDMAVLFPQTIHSYQAGAGECRVVLVIAKPSLAGDYAGVLTRCRAREPRIRAAAVPAEIPVIFGQMLRFWGQPEGEQICRGYLQVLLALSWESLRPEPSAAGGQDVTRRALEYLMEHYARPLSQEEMARALGFSRCQLSRLFHERLGMGFHAYINALRVQRAQELLVQTDLQVTEIAYVCGFENPRTFNRAFLKECGFPPRQYRRAQAHHHAVL